MPVGECLLCKQQSELQLSHVIPAFVFRWKRETSGNGYMRTSREPNRRVQDGPQEHWLCARCEELFGKDEREFATRLFYPYHNDAVDRIQYGPWLARCCASISWRTLVYYQRQGLDDWSDQQRQRASDAAAGWRQFLLGNTSHPGEYRLHLLPVDEIASATDPNLPTNINRYLMRAVDLDVVRSAETLFTYSKIARLIIIGSIRETAGQWEGTRVGCREGLVEPRRYSVPGEFGAFLKGKAVKMGESQAQMSDRQRAKVDETFLRNVDSVRDSDLARALNADYEMFGAAAFKRGPGPSDSTPQE